MNAKNSRVLLIISILVLFLGVSLIIGKINVISIVKSKINNARNTNYYPQVSKKVSTNPYMGLVPGAESQTINEPFSMVYAGASWKELEQEKGKYNFQKFEEKYRFDYWRQKGVKIILRIYMDYPTKEKHMDIPDWLYKEIGQDGIWYDSEGNKGFSPNYRNKALIENHQRLIKAFSDRYEDDSSIAFIELGSVGHWGEWHTCYIPSGKDTFPKTDVTDLYVEPYIDYFKNKKLLMRRPFKIASDNNMGLFNDSFGDIKQTEEYFINWSINGYKDHNVDQYLPSMPDYWKKAPSGGEFASFPGEIYIENNSIDRTLSMIENSHTSWLGPSLPGYNKLSEEKQKNLEKVLNLMGYHFTVARSTYLGTLSQGESQKGSVLLSNTGVAPFYFEWPIYISVYDSLGNEVEKVKLNYDIRNLLPGESEISYEYNLSKDLNAGTYSQRLYIEDPDTEKPAIQFENIRVDDRKEYFIGSFNIKSP